MIINILNSIKAHKFFEIFVISIIILSALLVGAKTYEIPEQIYFLVKLLDQFIVIFFLFEILLRFTTERDKKNFFKNTWNIFDTLIVTVSILPFEDSELAFVGRLIRVFRVLRMISFVPELRVLLNSFLKALPQLGYIVVLIFIFFYIFGAIGSVFFESINPELWGNINISMLTLFRVMTFEDWTDVMYETMQVYPLSWAYYLSFIFVTSFAFLNMVIGVVVNVLEKESNLQKLNQSEPSITLNTINNELKELKALLKQLNNPMK